MNNDTWRVLRCVAGAWLLLAASHAWPVAVDCDNEPNLTPTQREVCRQASKGNINAAFGANAIAFQQMSTQSDIRLNSVSATSMSRDVQCVAAGRNGAPTAGCPEVARVGGPAATREATKPVGPFGVTVIGAWGTGKQDDGRDQTGFDSRLAGFTAIVDHRFAGNLLAGVSLGYQDTKLDFNFNSGSLETKAYRGAVFASYVPVLNASLQGLVGFGSVSYDSNRVCSACGPNGEPGTKPTRNVASYDGQQTFASLGGSYVLPVAAWHLGGYVRGDYVRASTDGYTETPLVMQEVAPGVPSSNALQVDPQKATSLTSALGALASYSAVWGGVSVAPAVRLEWVHEFKDDSRAISSRFVTAQTAIVSLPTASPIRDWAILGLSLRAGFTRSLGGFIDYNHLFKSDARYDVVSAGLRYEF
jgi:outer membrane lipase/esterase